MAPYPLVKLDEFTFEFITKQGIVYSCSFLDYGYLFAEFPEFSADVYSFNLDVIDGNVYEQSMDEKIAETVIAVFHEFFRIKQNVIIYVCDTSDERHYSRKRKFDFWFWKYNDGRIIKEDDIAMIAGVQIYNSLLLLKENMLLDKIVKAFHTLNERLNDDDLESGKGSL